MKQIPMILLLVIGLSSLGLNQIHGTESELNGNVRRQVLTLEREWIAALIRSDSAAVFKRILSDDYTFIGVNGGVLAKSNYLEEPEDNPFVSLKPDDVRLRVYGDTAVTTGRMVVELKGHIENVRYTNVYARRHRKWLLASTQFTRIEAQ